MIDVTTRDIRFLQSVLVDPEQPSVLREGALEALCALGRAHGLDTRALRLKFTGRAVQERDHE